MKKYLLIVPFLVLSSTQHAVPDLSGLKLPVISTPSASPVSLPKSLTLPVGTKISNPITLPGGTIVHAGTILKKPLLIPAGTPVAATDLKNLPENVTAHIKDLNAIITTGIEDKLDEIKKKKYKYCTYLLRIGSLSDKNAKSGKISDVPYIYGKVTVSNQSQPCYVQGKPSSTKNIKGASWYNSGTTDGRTREISFQKAIGYKSDKNHKAISNFSKFYQTINKTIGYQLDPTGVNSDLFTAIDAINNETSGIPGLVQHQQNILTSLTSDQTKKDKEASLKQLKNLALQSKETGKKYNKTRSSMFELLEGDLGEALIKHNEFNVWLDPKKTMEKFTAKLSGSSLEAYNNFVKNGLSPVQTQNGLYVEPKDLNTVYPSDPLEDKEQALDKQYYSKYLSNLFDPSFPAALTAPLIILSTQSDSVCKSDDTLPSFFGRMIENEDKTIELQVISACDKDLGTMYNLTITDDDQGKNVTFTPGKGLSIS